ncbi:MAG: cytochrome C [Verrucomicrobiota bacterium]
MPIYEFYSPDTHKIYSFFARSLSWADRVPRCPDDPQARMERCVSSFAVTGRAKEEGEDGPDADDPRMEAAMAQLEREMGGLDEDNPDPRQLGHLMRRMSELTGQSLPGSMEEMVSRLEAGEDPESLEEQFGDAFDDEGEWGGDDAEGATGGRVARWWKRHRAPARDAQLYELRDYCDNS